LTAPHQASPLVPRASTLAPPASTLAPPLRRVLSPLRRVLSPLRRVLSPLGYRPLDLVDEVLDRQRLGHILRGAHAQDTDTIPLLVHGAGSDDNNGNVTGVLVGLEPADHLVTVHAWHFDIEQDQVRLTFGHPLQGLLAVGCPKNLVAMKGQGLLHQGQDIGIIVHHQHFGL